MRSLTTLVLFQLFVLSVFSQGTATGIKPLIGTIKGNVEDSGGKPLDAVSVSLLKKPDSTTAKIAITDRSGEFTFLNIPAGKYILSVTHIGYAVWYSQPLEISTSKPSISTGAIRLLPSGASLDQVTVVGKKPPVEVKIDKTVVNVDASPTNGGLSALEVLEKSPGVMVDNDGNISLKGKQGVIIMIDGKPTYLGAQDLTNYLKNMPANLLDQVEIMSQPPAKYDAAGNSGVINLITKRNRNNGFNGSINATAIIARYFKSPNSRSEER